MPVPRDEPPVDVAYQLMVPADAVAPSTTVPVPHLVLKVVLVIVGQPWIPKSLSQSTCPVPENDAGSILFDVV